MRCSNYADDCEPSTYKNAELFLLIKVVKEKKKKTLNPRMFGNGMRLLRTTLKFNGKGFSTMKRNNNTDPKILTSPMVKDMSF